jgi:hypothetical protein
MKKTLVISVFALVAVSVFTIGCGKDPGTIETYDPVAVKNAEVQRIQNEKFMPADQKAAALARLGVRPVYDKKTATH